MQVEKTQDEQNLIDYVLKVLKPGFDSFEKEPDVLGCRTFSVSVPDLYANKRVLFVKNTGLDKHGTFGNFWAKGWSNKKFWDQVKKERKQIEENMKDPRVRRLVEHMHKTMGFSLPTAKWAFALNPESVESTQPAQKKPTPTRVRAPRRITTLYRGKKKPNKGQDRPILRQGSRTLPKPVKETHLLVVEERLTDVVIPLSRPP